VLDEPPHVKRPALIDPRLVAMQLCYGMSWSTFLLLPKFLTLRLSASPSEVGMVSAIPSMTAALLMPLLAAHIDRVGRRQLIVVGTALATVYALGFLAVTHVGPLLFALQFVQGIAFAVQFNGASALVADLAPRERMAQALGIFGSANVVTNAIAPAIAEPLATSAGWAFAFAMSAAAGGASLALALALPRAASPAGQATWSEAAAAPNRQLRYAFAMACCGVAMGCTFTFYQPFAISLGMTDVGSFFVGFAAVVVFVRLALGGVIDRVGRGRIAFASMVGYAVTVASMTQLSPGTLPFFGASIGVAHGLVFPSLLALAVEHGNPRQRGRIVTHINGGFQIGMTLSVFGLGWLVEWAGFPAGFAAAAVCAGFGAALLLPELRSTAHAVLST
jgi:MFS family permease